MMTFHSVGRFLPKPYLSASGLSTGKVSFGQNQADADKRARKTAWLSALGLSVLAATGGGIQANKAWQNWQSAAQIQQAGTQLSQRLPGLQEAAKSLVAQTDTLDLSETVRRVASANVQIISPELKSKEVKSQEWGHSTGTGKWIVVLRNGEAVPAILTNYHVVKKAVDDQINFEIENPGTERQEPTFRIRLYAGNDAMEPRWVEAKIAARADGKGQAVDSATDTALLLPADPHFVLPPDISPLSLKGRNLAEQPLRPGEPVFIIGNPHQVTDNVTAGTYAGVIPPEENLEKEGALAKSTRLLGVTAAANSGNSGGLAGDAAGNFIGTPTMNVTNADGAAIVVSAADILKLVEEKWKFEVR